MAVLFASALPLLSACSSGGPDQELERAASWAATARMIAESRAAKATSDQYARVALHAAHAELTASVTSLDEMLRSPEKSKGLTAGQRARSLEAARDVEEAVGEMVSSAEQSPENVTMLERLATRASFAGQTAKALADSAKSQ